MQAYAGQAKESNTATGESESKWPKYNSNQEDILTPDVFQHLHTGRFNTMVPKTQILPQKHFPVTSRTGLHVTLKLVHMYQPFFNLDPPNAQSTTTATLPFGFKLQLTLESTQKFARFVRPPPSCGPTPYFSAHLQPDAARVKSQHSARPQADGHHAERPLRQGAPRDQGPRRTLALGINLGAGNVLCPACCGRLISRCPLKFRTRPLSTSCCKVIPERESLL